MGLSVNGTDTWDPEFIFERILLICYIEVSSGGDFG